MSLLECIHPVVEQSINPKGIIFAVTAVPTQGDDGQEGIGGIGETWFAGILGEVVHQPTLGFGKAMRVLAEQQRGRSLSDPEFEAWRKELADTGTVQFEFEVDRTLWEMAQNSALQNGPAVIAGKAVSFLKKKMLRGEEKPAVVAIGVSIGDGVATLRNWKREHKGSDVEPSREELERVAARRHQRLQDERQTFARAYREEIPDYSHDSVLASVHYLFDNTPERTAEEMRAIAVDFLNQLVAEVPSLAPFLITFLSSQTEG